MAGAALCCRSAVAAEQGFVGFAVGGGCGAAQTAAGFAGKRSVCSGGRFGLWIGKARMRCERC